jgi:hypothetical protein
VPLPAGVRRIPIKASPYASARFAHSRSISAVTTIGGVRRQRANRRHRVDIRRVVEKLRAMTAALAPGLYRQASTRDVRAAATTTLASSAFTVDAR